MNRQDVDGGCISSDCTGAYAHGLTVALTLRDLIFVSGERPLPACPGCRRPGTRMLQVVAGLCTMRPGSVSYVSHRARAYSRLLLPTYVRWQRGLLTASDWLQPVTRGGGGLARGSTNHYRGTG